MSTTTATDADGAVELEMTPEGGNLRIEIDACIGIVVGAGPLVGTLVCQKAFILRGLVVAPSNVTLGPGAQQQFTAELVGVAEPVTWSAEGGTIDETGRFTAGNQAGTFTVTATSIDNPSLTANAEVTIEVQESDFPVSALWEGFLNRQSRSPRKGWMATRYDPNTGELRASTCEGSDENCLGDFVGCDALWEGNVSGSQFSLTQVNHTNACAIGQPGQNRLYGCTLTGTVSEDADNTLRLVAAGDGGFFSCLAGDVEVSFEGCVGGCPEDQQASEPTFDPND